MKMCSFQAAYNVVQQYGDVTVEDIAAIAGITEKQAAGAVRGMYKRGYLMRARKGRRWAYSVHSGGKGPSFTPTGKLTYHKGKNRLAPQMQQMELSLQRHPAAPVKLMPVANLPEPSTRPAPVAPVPPLFPPTEMLLPVGVRGGGVLNIPLSEWAEIREKVDRVVTALNRLKAA